MPNSKITSEHQTTVPREIRGQQAFLKRRGSVRVGPGSISEDIAKARALRGTGDVDEVPSR